MSRGLMLVMGLCVALALCAACSERPSASEQGHYPVDPMYVRRAAQSARLAFTLMGDPYAFVPLVVISSSGHREFISGDSPGKAHPAHLRGDFPMNWFPDGKRLLFQRCFDEKLFESGIWVCLNDLLVLSLEESHIESLSSGKGGLKDGFALADNEVICRATEKSRHRPGLYLYRRSETGWKANVLLRDTGQLRWVKCLWAAPPSEARSIIVKAEEDHGDEFRLRSYWSLELATTGGLEPQLLVRPREDLSGEAVSPDGTVLAVVRRDWRIPKRLALIALQPEAGEVKNIDCGPDVGHPEFSPSGGELLLWEVGSFDRSHAASPPEVRIMDMTDLQMRKVALRSSLGPRALVSSVSWLTPGVLTIGVEDRGIVTLDLSTRKCETLWRMPEPHQLGASKHDSSLQAEDGRLTCPP